MIAPVYQLNRICRPKCTEWKKTELEELNQGDEVWSLGKLSQLEFVEQNHREGGVAQKKGSDSFIVFNSSLCLSQFYTSV